jgi:hypothetical protein
MGRINLNPAKIANTKELRKDLYLCVGQDKIVVAVVATQLKDKTPISMQMPVVLLSIIPSI